MTTEDLKSIIEETIDETVVTLHTLTGAPLTSSKDALNTAFLSYEGKATLASGQKLLWALNRDEEGWELSTLDDR